MNLTSQVSLINTLYNEIMQLFAFFCPAAAYDKRVIVLDHVEPSPNGKYYLNIQGLSEGVIFFFFFFLGGGGWGGGGVESYLQAAADTELKWDGG